MNVEKLELEPKQIFDFVGYQFDLRAGRIQPTPDRWQNLQDKILEILSLPACPVQQFMSLIGVPQGRSDPTDTGPLAEPSGQDTRNTVTTGLSGSAVHVSDRCTNSCRKADSHRPASYETHTVASQKQLEGTRVTKKGDSNTKVLAPTFTMVAARGQWPYRPTITPNKTCSANLYRRIKRRVGRSPKRMHCKRHLVPSGKQVAYQLPKTQGSLSSLKRVPRPLHTQDSTCSDGQHHSGVIHKQGRRHEVGPTLCSTMENLDLVHQESSNSQSPTHSKPANVVADKLSRLGHAIQTGWSLLQEVFQTICSRWHRLQIDLFATRFNKLPLFVSPVPHSLATAVDALSLPWEDLDAYAFPPAAILGKVVEKLQDSPCKRIILIAPGWPNMPWFWDLVTMSSQIPLNLSFLPNLLTQPFNEIPHRNLTNLNLHSSSLPWEDLDAYAFPPAAILGKVVEKLQDSPCKRIILIAPGWPNMPWFWDLVTMSSQIPLNLSFLPNLLTPLQSDPSQKSDKPKSLFIKSAMGESGCICLPTSSHLGQSGGEVAGLPMQKNHSDCSGVAQHALVLGSSDHVQSDPTKPVLLAQPVITALQSDPSQKSDKPKSPFIKEQGFSEAVAARIEAPQR